jgi:hypothetical protein
VDYPAKRSRVLWRSVHVPSINIASTFCTNSACTRPVNSHRGSPVNARRAAYPTRLKSPEFNAPPSSFPGVYILPPRNEVEEEQLFAGWLMKESAGRFRPVMALSLRDSRSERSERQRQYAPHRAVSPVRAQQAQRSCSCLLHKSYSKYLPSSFLSKQAGRRSIPCSASRVPTYRPWQD